MLSPTSLTYRVLEKCNGALTSDGTRTYQYDVEQRLTKIIRPGGYSTELYYNGFGELTEIQEKSGTTVTRDRFYLWCEGRICEERDQTNAVTRRFSEYGYRVEGGTPANYFYTKDHLGSIREITNSSGTVLARYDYDPYGKMTQVYGSTLAPPFGYAGYFYHAESGLYLTHFRAYDPRIGRWLTRDPIGEAGGQNLYGYVGGNPSNGVDPWGLAFGDYWDIKATVDYYNDVSSDSSFGSTTQTAAMIGSFLLQNAGMLAAQQSAENFGQGKTLCGGMRAVQTLFQASTLAFAPSGLKNFATWAENPWQYERAATTVNDALYQSIEHLSPAERAAQLPLFDYTGNFAQTMPQGPTPAAWLALIPAAKGASKWTDFCGCQ